MSGKQYFKLSLTLFFTFLVLSILIYWSGKEIFQRMIVPPAGVTLEEWIEVTLLFSVLSLTFAFIFTGIWICLSVKYFKFTVEELSGQKYLSCWVALLIMSVAVPFIFNLFIKDPSEGKLLSVCFLFLISSLIPFWALSVIFSRPGVKYIPFLSRHFRN